ncbi:lipocalin family protein [Luteirhabdus pelagi]|uniref:lipocalin family protein n=1 Tax=Luteirhabdus pelagi TaxID=2792783 RepID=UPI001939367C|nr:lipocalin family protein [Luteirhabdus pelagi]
MKVFSIFLAVLLFCSSCKSDDDDVSGEVDLVGTWTLIEVYGDPGDGSGSFESVTSDKKLVFQSDGTITSNGLMCDMTTDTATSSSGTYSETESTFNSDDCNNPDYNYPFERNGNILIVSYPCIEACQAKYRKE